MSHVELITKTISTLLDGSPRGDRTGGTYNGKATGKTNGKAGKNGTAPLDMAKEQQNPHHYIIGAQAALPVDAAGNPWNGAYVHNHGNLVSNS